MKLLKNTSTYVVIFLVLFACCTQETEAMRRVLRGRRTLTRGYFTGMAIPGWALVAIIAIVELLLGVALYFVMRKFIISSSVEKTNTYAPAPTTAYTPVPTTGYTPAPTAAYPPAQTSEA